MKFSSIYAAGMSALILAACSGNKKAETSSVFPPIDFTLTVTNIEGLDSTYAYLYNWEELTGWREFPAEALLDSALIVDGKAVFTLENCTAPILGMLLNNLPYVVIPDAGDNTYDVATTTGSGAAAKAMKAYYDSDRSIRISANANAPAYDDPAYEAYNDSINNMLRTLNRNTLSDNLSNPFGMYLLTTFADIESSQIDSLININPNLAKSKRIQAMIDGCKKYEATSAGHPYVDFEIEYDGVTKKLSDYVKPGEYTLVDFWASWCGPCKRAIAGLKDNYDALKAEGLNIVGVAVWEDAENTKAWLAENPLPWPLILNAQDVPVNLYSIRGIPTMLLIGPDGTILARSYVDEEILDAFHQAINAE